MVKLADFFMDLYSDAPPVITVVEPSNADCIFRTAAADDGRLHSVGGDLSTIMAGLACGEPCSIVSTWRCTEREETRIESSGSLVNASNWRETSTMR